MSRRPVPDEWACGECGTIGGGHYEEAEMCCEVGPFALWGERWAAVAWMAGATRGWAWALGDTEGNARSALADYFAGGTL